jgi:DNA-binding NarL/FixJ family response regulator
VRVPSEIRVTVIEDQRDTRDGLVSLVGGSAGYRIVGSYGSMEDALRGLAGASADVALLDIALPGMSGIEGVKRLRAEHAALQVLMLTIYDDQARVFEAICAGATGYLLKDTPPARLLEAIAEIHKGGAPMSPDIARKVITMFAKAAPPPGDARQMTPREIDVLNLLADGHSYKTAAAALSISPETIRFHLRNIYDKLHVHSKSEAVVRALRAGLIR